MHDERTKEGLLEEIQRLQDRVTELKKVALYDSLTGLPNRVMLKDRFTVAQGHAKRTHETIMVIMVDVDHFKAINDTHGHQVGDEILKEVASRLTSCLREYDTVARIGGDEFVVMVSCSSKRMKKILKRMVKEFKRLFSRKIKVTASIGVALYPQDGLELEDILAKADQAMYASKKAGRDRYTFAE